MPTVKASDIRRVAVYPPLGIARVGNASDDDAFVLAAETIGGQPESTGGFRDSSGRIKRQAVRFRIYAELLDGSVVELHEDVGATIEWRVEIANLKAGWYAFGQAMDLPQGLSKATPMRNGSIGNRTALDICPTRRTISGRSSPGVVFSDGTFLGKAVTLGELRTDEVGRLIFLGGMGSSSSNDGSPPTTFANNDKWHDDVADGPVRARVVVDGAPFEADAGYVVVAPPNFAPGLFGVVTMDDVVRDLFFREGMLPAPTDTSFTRDIWPIFDRMSGLGWVNHGLFVAHGVGSPLHARTPEVIARLQDGSPAAEAWRSAVLGLFLGPDLIGPADHTKLPQVFGDAYGEGDGFEWKLERLAVTPTMHRHLQRWRDGDFVADWPGAVPTPPSFASLSPALQIEHLTRAAFHECLGGPFHPGIELTWIMRRRSLWRAPYRLNLLPEGTKTPQDFGPQLTPAVCLAQGGPLNAAGPGALTRWLGIPWQTDEASCNSEAEYAPSLYLSMPTFWGARVPDQVLSEEAWSRVTATNTSDMQRWKHFFHREDWLRDIRGRRYEERIANMVEDWWHLGVVTPRSAGPIAQALGVPTEVHVESGRHPSASGSNEKLKLIARLEDLTMPVSHDDGAPPPSGPLRPPRRSYRRGEV